MSHVDPARQDVVVATRGTNSRTTVIVSLAAHVIVLAAVLVVPIFAHVRLPAPSARIGAYVLAAAIRDIPLPVAPAPRHAARPAPATGAPVAGPAADASAAAPIVAPSGIAAGDPRPLPAGGSLDGVPGAMLGGGRPVLGTLPPPPTPPPTPGTRPLRVGGDIRAPRKLHHVAPVYPAIAAQARVTGTVILEATISPAGEVVDVGVLRSVPLLDAAAIDAVRQWRYDPPRLNGSPVSVLLTVTVRFSQ